MTLVPCQRAPVLILDNSGLEEILLLFQIHGLRHPREGIFGFGEDWFETDLSATAVRDEVHILLTQARTQAKETPRHGVSPICSLELSSRPEHSLDLFLE